MKYRRYLVYLLILLLLTLLSQVGALLVLIHCGIFHGFKKRMGKRIQKKSIYLLSLSIFYFMGIIWFVPALAEPFGRKPLSWKSEYIQASNFSTILFFRNYAVCNAEDILNQIALKTRDLSQNQDIKLVYLDANFPFLDGFPLLPHLSHSDGKKIDLAFIYTENGDYHPAQLPNMIGYGMYESPNDGEIDQPEICKNKGYWQYSALSYFTTRWRANLQADSNLNQCLGISICANQHINRVFLEPHLLHRWKLNSAKMKFHGCHAVRHDDHFHIEVR